MGRYGENTGPTCGICGKLGHNAKSCPRLARHNLDAQEKKLREQYDQGGC